MVKPSFTLLLFEVERQLALLLLPACGSVSSRVHLEEKDDFSSCLCEDRSTNVEIGSSISVYLTSIHQTNARRYTLHQRKATTTPNPYPSPSTPHSSTSDLLTKRPLILGLLSANFLRQSYLIRLRHIRTLRFVWNLAIRARRSSGRYIPTLPPLLISSIGQVVVVVVVDCDDDDDLSMSLLLLI